MGIYKFGSVIETNGKMFLYLDKYIIYDLNHRKLIDNYKYRGKDNYVYIPLNSVPKIYQNHILINEDFMFNLLKSKKRANLVKILPINNYNRIILKFKDGDFLLQSKDNIYISEIKLCQLINTQNYFEVIDSIIIKDSLTLDFYYNENTKSYIHKIKYLNKYLKNLEFTNNDFIFDILNPLIDILSNNELINYTLNDGNLNINGENSFCVNLYNFSNEFVIYVIDKLRKDNLGKTI